MEQASLSQAALIRSILTRMARERGETPEAVFQRYGRERLLARLSRSDYRTRFILKGASLFYVWSPEPHRATKDIDFLGLETMNTDTAIAIFKELCVVRDETDGMQFLPDSVMAEDMQGDSDYPGIRVKLWGMLTKAKVRVQIDIGLGDAVTPAAEWADYPALLPGQGLEHARLLAYPKETVVAEKTQAIVRFGAFNSRMKDYYDLHEMSRSLTFDGSLLQQAVQATFTRRHTDLPKDVPTGLTDAFAHDPVKRTQWNGFLSRSGLAACKLEDAIGAVRAFIWPVLDAAATGRGFSGTWTDGQQWI